MSNLIFAKPEYRVFSNIGLSAGEVSFASLFTSFFALEQRRTILPLLSLLATLFFWGGSWFLARRFKV